MKSASNPINSWASSYAKHSISVLLIAVFGSLSTPTAIAADTKPPLMLANVYHPGVPLADYWVSEKYDGVRGFWDGQKLLTRGGQPINAPAWFTANWPATPMDGELWAGRGQFQKAASTVRQQSPDDAAWRGIRFMVFDLPAEPGPFTDRLSALNSVVGKLAVPWVQAVAQSKVASHAALQSQLKQITKAGAEGLMLHRGSALYKVCVMTICSKSKPTTMPRPKLSGSSPARANTQTSSVRCWWKYLAQTASQPSGSNWGQA